MSDVIGVFQESLVVCDVLSDHQQEAYQVAAIEQRIVFDRFEQQLVAARLEVAVVDEEDLEVLQDPLEDGVAEFLEVLVNCWQWFGVSEAGDEEDVVADVQRLVDVVEDRSGSRVLESEVRLDDQFEVVAEVVRLIQSVLLRGVPHDFFEDERVRTLGLQLVLGVLEDLVEDIEELQSGVNLRLRRVRASVFGHRSQPLSSLEVHPSETHAHLVSLVVQLQRDERVRLVQLDLLTALDEHHLAEEHLQLIFFVEDLQSEVEGFYLQLHIRADGLLH